jgi:hypothetical protein
MGSSTSWFGSQVATVASAGLEEAGVEAPVGGGAPTGVVFVAAHAVEKRHATSAERRKLALTFMEPRFRDLPGD